MYGFGYRRWCKNSQCNDVRLHGIVKAAAAGIKAIIREEEEWSRRQDVMVQVNVIQIQTSVKEATVPQVPIHENVFETPVARSLETDVPQPEVKDSEVVPCDGEPPIAEKSMAGLRVLKVHHSETSTCALSCLQEERENALSDAASCADTEVWEPGRKRRHPRRPRTGRRARSRMRKERWEDARAEAGLEARGMFSASQVGELLACIAEDDSDEERRLRCGDIGVDPASESEEGFVITGPPLLGQCVGDGCHDEELESDEIESRGAKREAVDKEEHEDHDSHRQQQQQHQHQQHQQHVVATVAAELAKTNYLTRGRSSLSLSPGPACCDIGLAGERGPSISLSTSSDEGETTDECSDMDENDVEELAAWTDHAFWQELEDGPKLLPARLALAMMHLQTTALGWLARFGSENLHDWPVEECKLMIVDGARELEPKFRRVTAVMRHLAANWKSPQHLKSDWSALLEWLEEGEDGPCWQHRRFKDLLDELDESRFVGEYGSENLQAETSIRGRSLQEGWNQFQCYVDRLGAIQRRRLRRDQECAEQMNSRLAQSLAGRAVPWYVLLLEASTVLVCPLLS